MKRAKKPSDEVVTVKEAARRTRIPRSTLYRYIAAGRLETESVSGITMVSLANVRNLKTRKTCPECGDPFTTRLQFKIFCTRRCEKRLNVREWTRRRRNGV